MLFFIYSYRYVVFIVGVVYGVLGDEMCIDIIYCDVIINFGGGYNLINGVFIVLVSGIYVFFIIVVFWGDESILIDIVLNGNS